MTRTNSPANNLIPFVIGANHRSSGLSFRDRLFVEDPLIPNFLHGLTDQGIPEVLVLSTCDRVEVHGAHANPESIVSIIHNAFANHGEIDTHEFGDQIYALYGEAAVRHILRIASALESQVIGEPQVLGQLKAAHRIARAAGTIGGSLEPILQNAYNTAKRVVTETRIGERPVSIAAAAVQMARDVQGDLGQCRAVLIGDGEMGEIVATHLISAGIDVLTIMNDRMPKRTEDVARRLGCHAAPWETLSEELGRAEILVSALGRRTYSINDDMIRAATAKRRRKLMYIVDLALPGDVDPAVNRMDEAFLYDIGDLERVAMEGMSHRENEAGQAEAIIEEAMMAMSRNKAEREAVPTLAKFRKHVEGLREQSLIDAGGDAEKATNLLANRLLHDPSVVLRDIAASNNAYELDAIEGLLEKLFKLDDDNGE